MDWSELTLENALAIEAVCKEQGQTIFTEADHAAARWRIIQAMPEPQRRWAQEAEEERRWTEAAERNNADLREFIALWQRRVAIERQVEEFCRAASHTTQAADFAHHRQLLEDATDLTMQMAVLQERLGDEVTHYITHLKAFLRAKRQATEAAQEDEA